MKENKCVTIWQSKPVYVAREIKGSWAEMQEVMRKLVIYGSPAARNVMLISIMRNDNNSS